MKVTPLFSSKKTLTSLFLAFLIFLGTLYQWNYHQRRVRYEKAITGYYQTYFNREPDAIGLRHWVTWALNKWGLEKVRRVGFEEVSKKGAG